LRPALTTVDVASVPTTRVEAPRVLQVVLRLQPGGTEHLVIEMCRRLRPHYEVSVCCLEDEGEWAPLLRAEGIEVTALHWKQGFRPGVGRQLARVAHAHGARVLHCHQYSPFVYGCLARAWNPSLRLVYTEHGRLSDAPPPRKRQMVNPWLAHLAGPIVAVSHELREYMWQARFPKRGVSVVHNGIDAGTSPSTATRARARAMLGVSPQTPLFATVARLDPVKDFPTLLDAFAHVVRARPGARLLIAGDGPERARLEARAAQPDLAGHVEFLGYRADVRSWLPGADVYVNSSISEGVSVTILEAMAAGVPVIATAVGGTPEVINSRDVGVLVPARNPLALAEAMIALLECAGERRALAVAARLRVQTSFTIDRMVDAYVALYDGLRE
jgi:glycosyltransferase involved in cell wall biosynthesis